MVDVMNTCEQAVEILKRILDLCNQGHIVSFEEDLGGNTITVMIDGAHSHCGVPHGSFELLVEHLHDLLVNGCGLSFVKMKGEE